MLLEACVGEAGERPLTYDISSWRGNDDRLKGVFELYSLSKEEMAEILTLVYSTQFMIVLKRHAH